MLKALIAPISDILKEVLPDTDKRAQLAHDIATMAEKHVHETNIAQIEVNKVAASSPDPFTSRARPFILWVCGIALAYNFLIYPLLQFIVVMYMPEPPEFPVLETEELRTILFGLLGLSTLRTYEKAKGVARAS